MKLTDLEPRWISEHVFAFRCPCCKRVWLTCKNVVMEHCEQRNLAISANLKPTGPRYNVVLMDVDVVWSWTELDFEIMSVTPSVDASKSGHWHGFITSGQIR